MKEPQPYLQYDLILDIIRSFSLYTVWYYFYKVQSQVILRKCLDIHVHM